ncbi:hypothetical protein LDG_5904 [Legionella drancourtii LLAP12]|uniref:Uncharacterized protein n=2 Tax=Legionella drancourtii TaxID=168933 RepID=G9EL08_9GAMM|nr:hypothetical protein LDG_5904 [Legionella drancourtii LLAP12]
MLELLVLTINEAKSAALTAFAPTENIQTNKNKLDSNALTLSIHNTPFVQL